MLDYTFLRRDIETFLEDNWTETLTEFENVPLTDPEATEYISLYDTISTSVGETLGTDATIKKGILAITIHTQLGTGTNRSRYLASLLAGFFEKETITNVQFGVAELKGVPAETKDTHFKQVLIIPYMFGYGTNEVAC